MNEVSIQYFIEEVYKKIASGNHPSTANVKSTNTDDYFRGLALHPYHFSDMPESWKGYLDDIYDVVIKNGDKGKKIFFTEMGWYDGNATSNMDQQEDWVRKLYTWCLEDLWYVESCIYFRFYNNSNAVNWAPHEAEQTFGVFFEASDTKGIVPKGKARVMQKIFGGTGDLDAWSDINRLNEKIASKP